jgi:hypothetical protein
VVAPKCGHAGLSLWIDKNGGHVWSDRTWSDPTVVMFRANVCDVLNDGHVSGEHMACPKSWSGVEKFCGVIPIAGKKLVGASSDGYVWIDLMAIQPVVMLNRTCGMF